jgi:cobalt-precorrin-6B (C15)-methyltransferase
MAPLWPYATPGIPDALFEQMPGIPISKREVRLLIIGALRLHPSAVLWDIGAGIGTIAVEAALLCPAGQVVAIERDEDVVSVIRHNCDRFGLNNVTVIDGIAPDCLDTIQAPPRLHHFGRGTPVKAGATGRLAVFACGGAHRRHHGDVGNPLHRF